MTNLKKYEPIVGREVIARIHACARPLAGRRIVCVSSTHQGGGVAEMLNSVVILFNEIGIDFGWRLIHGSPDFFSITKKIHNALQGGRDKLSDREKRFYLKTNRRFSVFTHLNHDLVLVHDPQPLALIDCYRKKQPWILRLHIDLSAPEPSAWRFLKPYISRYDHVVVSDERFGRGLKDTSVILPAIDPCSPKNKELSAGAIEAALRRAGIEQRKPIIAQISRYDKWKDPEGVIRVFDRVRKKVDCQLVLLGNLAADDPEGVPIYNRLREKYGHDRDIRLLVNVEPNDLTVNALQRRAAVIIQKSTREGFGLTVTEALYKGTPVVGSRVGGIRHQIIDGFNGYLSDPKDYGGFAAPIVKILKDHKLKARLGENARRHVVDNFLVTRLILDWLGLFNRFLP